MSDQWFFDPDNQGRSFHTGYGLLDEYGHPLGIFIETDGVFNDGEQRWKAKMIADDHNRQSDRRDSMKEITLQEAADEINRLTRMLKAVELVPTTIEAVRVEESDQELRHALFLLIHTYLTLSRAEYEDGMTMNELHDHVCAFLWNHQLQPGLPEHHEYVRQFLADYQATAKTKLPSADEILERMARNALR